MVPWFQRFIFIIFIAKGRGKINLWNQGIQMATMERNANDLARHACARRLAQPFP
jgi:hypothetical protein